MIIDLPNTSTRQVNRSMVRIREEGGAVALGRVLTLVIASWNEDEIEESIQAANSASREHPCRILVVTPQNSRDGSGLDAQIRVGGDAGASEVIVLRPWGDLVRHPDTLIMPLLLPDAPIVTWWPSSVPQNPKQDPLGRMAQRRITDTAACQDPLTSLETLRENYTPGDTDLAWTRLTRWRSLIVMLLEQPPNETVTSVKIEGDPVHVSLNLLAGWLGSNLNCPVEVIRHDDAPAITRVELHRESGPIVIDRPDSLNTTISSPGQPDRHLPLPIRTLDECLAEELRRLDPDEVYGEVLAASVGN